MLYIQIVNGRAVRVSETPQQAAGGWINRNDIESFADAHRIASELTQSLGELGEVYLATHSPNTWPAFDVIRAPCIGDAVSYSFNGDSYPCGRIVRISASYKVITTSTGPQNKPKLFYRRLLTGSWLSQDWSLIQGHINERNPHL